LRPIVDEQRTASRGVYLYNVAHRHIL